ncbi:MAG: thiamine phosphate synthase [Acidobacteriota bacterium]|nr:thiamine phosphate synthase [Acidobacteriota bacterium]
MLRYAITDRALFAPEKAALSADYRQDALTQQAWQLAAEGVHLLQIREKDLPASQLYQLLGQVLAATAGSPLRVLVNGRADVAAAAGAAGVHLTAHPGELTAAQVRAIFAHAGRPAPYLSASCHSLAEVQRAAAAGVDLLLFGPVFGKTVQGVALRDGLGLDALRAACATAAPVPVLALGGVTPQNTAACLAAGAAGVAGIRLFACAAPPS